MEKITDLILKISRLSQTELINMYREMQHVLEHNYNVLMQANSAKDAIDAIVKRYQA